MSKYEKKQLMQAVSELEHEVSLLEREYNEKCKLFDIRNQIGALSYHEELDKECGDSFKHYRIGAYDLEKLKKLPAFSDWESSPYVTHPIECEKVVRGSFHPDYIEYRMHALEFNPFSKKIFTNFSITALCLVKAAVPFGENYKYIIADPYNDVLTDEVCNKDIESVMLQNINKYVVADLNYSREAIQSGPVITSVEPFKI